MRNRFDGWCEECRAVVRAGQGICVRDESARRGYVVLCLEHAPEAWGNQLALPVRPDAARLPSIHVDD